MLLFLCLYESWLTEAIVLDYACGESHVRRHSCRIVGVERVALKEQPTSFPQASHGVAGDGTIEEQRVGVGDEEGEVGFVSENIGMHIGSFAVADIGRVADDDVP